MNTFIPSLTIIAVAAISSIACSLPGMFLVLQHKAMLSDAISHAILPGIVIMFLCTHSINSLPLIVGATVMGVITVFITEKLILTRYFNKDTSIGLVFPLFFSLGTILISLFTRDIHLDIDMVLLGEIAFTPFNRWFIYGYDLGPYALWSATLLLIINALFIFLFYHELKIITFSPIIARTLSLPTTFLHYTLMTLTSITCVCSFNHIGSIIVVALMLTPSCTALLLCSTVSSVLIMGCAIALYNACIGYIIAYITNTSIAGSIAASAGILFLLGLLISPTKKKLLFFQGSTTHTHHNETLELATLTYYLKTYPSRAPETIAHHLNWNIDRVRSLLHKIQSNSFSPSLK
ncbi:MAG: metal ABC transporter permease [Candidatus Babeliales bacterium]